MTFRLRDSRRMGGSRRPLKEIDYAGTTWPEVLPPLITQPSAS